MQQSPLVRRQETQAVLQCLFTFTFPGNPCIWLLTEQLRSGHRMDRRLHAAEYVPQSPQMPWSRRQFVGDPAPGPPEDEESRVLLPGTYSMHLWHVEARSSRCRHHD